MTKSIRYILEAGALYFTFSIFRILPVDAASGLGGFIGRIVGPRLAASRKADANLKAAMPEMNEPTRRNTIREMWDNLGRVIAEYPHLRTIATHRTTVEDISVFHRLRDDNKPGLIIGAHMANWEIAGAVASVLAGFPLDAVYRAPNNPYTDRLLKKIRALGTDLRSIPKSKTGTRHLVQSLPKDGRHIGILIDQKYNEGINVPFFNRPAMTSPIFVHLAQKFDCPLILTRLERTKGANFRVSAVAIPYKDEAGAPLPDTKVVAATHAHLERWIRERPGQWLWLHRRWSGRAERLA